MRIVLVAVAVAVQLGAAATQAFAQHVTLTPTPPRNWEGSIHLGWFSGDAPAAGDWNDWYDAPVVSVDVGRYWTSHLKTEAGVSVAGEGRFYSQRRIDNPGQPAPAYRFTEHLLSSTQASGALTYQFLENAWVHPFVSAGVLVVREKERRAIQDPFGVPVGALPAIRSETARQVRAHAFLGGGLKLYVNERAFIRTDARLMLGAPRISAFAWRAGIGVDF
jgi:hypothetical protein